MASEELHNLRLKTQLSMAPSISIMQSKKQIDDIQLALDYCKDQKSSTIQGIRNRQISSGVIIDWKQFEENSDVKSQLLLRDGEKDEKTIFSYVVEEWNKQEPSKVIYRWLRKALPMAQNQLPQFAHLVEEEHIYRGPMKHFKKHGQGVYIIVKRFSDNSEKIKSVKGEWVQDILKNGTFQDQNGKEQYITSNVLKLSMRSKKMITPYLQKNATIEKMRKKSQASNGIGVPPTTNSGNSLSSIRKFK